MLLRDYSFLIKAGEEIKPPISGFVVAYKSGDANTPVKVKTYDVSGVMLTSSNLLAGEKLKTPKQYETVILSNETGTDLNCVFVLGSGEYQSDRASGDVNILTLPDVIIDSSIPVMVGVDKTSEKRGTLKSNQNFAVGWETIVPPTENVNGMRLVCISYGAAASVFVGTATSMPASISEYDVFLASAYRDNVGIGHTNSYFDVIIPAGMGLYKYSDGGSASYPVVTLYELY